VNRRLLLGVAAALAVIVLWYFLLWSPRGNAIEKAKSRQEAARVALLELRAEARRLADLRRNEASIRARIEQLRQAIPDEPNLAQFILDANEAANRSGIDFLSIAPTPPAAASSGGGGAPPPAQITLSITLTGGYFQVLDFVNLLNRLSRIVVVDSLNVSSDDGASLSVQLGAMMFVTSVPEGAGIPSAGGAPTTTTTAAPGASTTVAPGATPTTAPAAGVPTSVAG
jgi:Tfp pilus assembly protein PilO